MKFLYFSLFLHVNYALVSPPIIEKLITVDYDTYTFNTNPTGELLNNFHITGNYNLTGKPYSAYIATFPAAKFSVYPAHKNGCIELIQVSTSSQSYNCEYATNGAFFAFSGNELCIGNLISDGKVWRLLADVEGTNRANFGLTSDGKAYIGFMGRLRSIGLT